MKSIQMYGLCMGFVRFFVFVFFLYIFFYGFLKVKPGNRVFGSKTLFSASNKLKTFGLHPVFLNVLGVEGGLRSCGFPDFQWDTGTRSPVSRKIIFQFSESAISGKTSPMVLF